MKINDLDLLEIIKMIRYIIANRFIHLGEGKSKDNLENLTSEFNLSSHTLRRRLDNILRQGYLYSEDPKSHDIDRVHSVYCPTPELDRYCIKLLNGILEIVNSEYFSLRALATLDPRPLEKVLRLIKIDEQQKSANPLEST